MPHNKVIPVYVAPIRFSPAILSWHSSQLSRSRCPCFFTRSLSRTLTASSRAGPYRPSPPDDRSKTLPIRTSRRPRRPGEPLPGQPATYWLLARDQVGQRCSLLSLFPPTDEYHTNFFQTSEIPHEVETPFQDISQVGVISGVFIFSFRSFYSFFDIIIQHSLCRRYPGRRHF